MNTLQTPQIPSLDWQENATPQQILRWAVENYAGRLTMATAFGAEGCSLLHMISVVRDEIGLAPDIFNLDTGFQFGQTLALRAQIAKKYDLEIRAIAPAAAIEDAEQNSQQLHGEPLHKTDPNLCCYWRKVVPLKSAVAGFDAWITAIRRDQTPERADALIIGPDPQLDLLKINPLANWTKDQVWDYIRENDVPYNPLHDQGFPSIGCWPCTRPVAANQDDREGRWAETDKTECGLHINHDLVVKRPRAIAGR